MLQSVLNRLTRRYGITITFKNVTGETVDLESGNVSESVTTITWQVLPLTDSLLRKTFSKNASDLGDFSFVSYLPNIDNNWKVVYNSKEYSISRIEEVVGLKAMLFITKRFEG